MMALNTVKLNVYAECRYAKRHYSESRYAECRGAVFFTISVMLRVNKLDRWPLACLFLAFSNSKFIFPMISIQGPVL